MSHDMEANETSTAAIDGCRRLVSLDGPDWAAAYEIAKAATLEFSVRPHCRHVLLCTNFDAGLAWLVGTDGENSVAIAVEGGVGSTGVIALPLDFERLLTLKQLHLFVPQEAGQLWIEHEHGGFRVPVPLTDDVNLDDLTRLDQPSGGSDCQLWAAAMLQLIRRTIFAADSESTRYALGCVQLEFAGEDGFLIGVGTDGRRLAYAQTILHRRRSLGVGEPVLVGVSEMRLLERLLQYSTGFRVFILDAGNGRWLFRTPRGRLVVKLHQGRFPIWQDVLPVDPPTAEVSLSRVRLLDAIHTIRFATDEDGRSVRLSLEPGSLSITREHGKRVASYIVPVQYAGPSVSQFLDAAYLADALGAVSNQKRITLRFHFDRKSYASNPIEVVARGFRYVLMPMAEDKK